MRLKRAGIAGCFVVWAVFSTSPLAAAPFLRGDVDGNRATDVTDAILLLGYLFLSQPVELACVAAADLNGDRAVDIADPVYLLLHLFAGGNEPPAPYPECGPDPGPQGLPCRFYPECGSEGKGVLYSTYLGGAGHELSGDKDSGNDVAVDAFGNIYVVGVTNSLGRYDTDIFVLKFDPSGSTLLYETYLDSGGTHDVAYAIAVDAVGNTYVTGGFGDGQLGSGLGVLVAKLDPAGVPQYEVTFGANSPGFSGDFGADIAVDDEGNAYVVGTTYGLGVPFPTTEGAFQRTFRGGLDDAFVVKLDPAGEFVYSTLLGSSGTDEGLSIAIRKVGDVYHAYVTGETGLAGDFPTTPGAFQTTFGGAADVFVTQLNDSGSALVYSTYLGGAEIDTGAAIAVDAAGNAHVTGATGGINFPIFNAFQPTYGGEGGATPAYLNAFVTKLNPTGSALVYSSYMGGGGGLTDAGYGIVVDGAGYVYLTGSTSTHPDIFTGSRFPIVEAFQPTRGGGDTSAHPDAFVTRLSPDGRLVFSSYLGGSYWDEGNGIALDASGNVYLTGFTMSADFPVTPDAFQPQLAGGGCGWPFSCPDAFVTKIADG